MEEDDEVVVLRGEKVYYQFNQILFECFLMYGF